MRYCIKIETKETYELFDNIKKAFEFLKENPKSKLSLVLANHTYKEKGELNYEDFADTLVNEIK